MLIKAHSRSLGLNFLLGGNKETLFKRVRDETRKDGNGELELLLKLDGKEQAEQLLRLKKKILCTFCM